MSIFSSGYLAVAVIFMLLFGHALRRRHALELDEVEVFSTKVSIGAAALQAFVAIVSLAIVAFAGEKAASSSGIIYPIILGPGFSIYYSIVGRKRRRLLQNRKG
jgi:hypothetical protein